jgi:hypothetical protein
VREDEKYTRENRVDCGSEICEVSVNIYVQRKGQVAQAPTIITGQVVTERNVSLLEMLYCSLVRNM